MIAVLLMAGCADSHIPCGDTDTPRHVYFGLESENEYRTFPEPRLFEASPTGTTTLPLVFRSRGHVLWGDGVQLGVESTDPDGVHEWPVRWGHQDYTCDAEGGLTVELPVELESPTPGLWTFVLTTNREPHFAVTMTELIDLSVAD